MFERLQAAQNRHDLEAFAGHFAVDYRSEQPLHPGAGFSGRDRVHTNGEARFAGIPGLRSELLRWAGADGEAWAEWRRHGTRLAGRALDLRGVTAFSVHDGRIVWGRLHMEPLQAAEVDIAILPQERTGPR